ncbi:mitochondrial potassium channel isoform X2 [Betta splendens]|uniref:Mitochondrial potassium channel isoform X2 n=1 Tax=Betta splendens TaxID=158456 RepID=A0A6P7MNE4_BETSP|nr:mitochondrial potassium channel isoform X2 [Betta splendens]XP_029007365.1 mitochondrial potassium channel isoform X2 [Betta splendens]XP_040926866.1 mitochondrial potassium channel isoform X2 [Betta splendens]XP_040926867.1 mitochondrial potassium channel isoform X2 [Betta splendens]
MRGAKICLWGHPSCCLPRLHLHGSLGSRIGPVRTYSVQQQPGSVPPANPAPPDGKSGTEEVKQRAVSALQKAGELGHQWGQRSAQTATATINYWWERYEEFVGLNEVREAQTKVAGAEQAFMVARGMVREAHASLESLQGRLKEVRDRLDRVSREEAHYLELATLEHKLLQEERRLRTTYENAESSERERFALFSAAVRESHEKERTRAERTKNWSIIGSVLGALIGVMGSTYINRVRLQELKSLLLEAQKGPESLQEALRVQAGNHRSQQDELRTLIDNLRVTLNDAFTRRGAVLEEKRGPMSDSSTVPLSALKDLHAGRQKAESLLESLPPQLGKLEQGLGRVESSLLMVRKLLDTRPEAKTQTGQVQIAQSTERPEGGDQWESAAVVRHLEDTQRTLAERIRTNTVYNAVFTYTATAITISAVYLLLRGVS